MALTRFQLATYAMRQRLSLNAVARFPNVFLICPTEAIGYRLATRCVRRRGVKEIWLAILLLIVIAQERSKCVVIEGVSKDFAVILEDPKDARVSAMLPDEGPLNLNGIYDEWIEFFCMNPKPKLLVVYTEKAFAIVMVPSFPMAILVISVPIWGGHFQDCYFYLPQQLFRCWFFRWKVHL